MKQKKIREQLMNIDGLKHKAWYESLTREEQLEYTFIIENERKKTPLNE
jgi:hypothetical protein